MTESKEGYSKLDAQEQKTKFASVSDFRNYVLNASSSELAANVSSLTDEYDRWWKRLKADMDPGQEKIFFELRDKLVPLTANNLEQTAETQRFWLPKGLESDPYFKALDFTNSSQLVEFIKGKRLIPDSFSKLLLERIEELKERFPEDKELQTLPEEVKEKVQMFLDVSADEQRTRELREAETKAAAQRRANLTAPMPGQAKEPEPEPVFYRDDLLPPTQKPKPKKPWWKIW